MFHRVKYNMAMYILFVYTSERTRLVYFIFIKNAEGF